MDADNKMIVRRLVEEVQNGHAPERMDAFFAPDFVNHVETAGASAQLNALAQAKLHFHHLFAAFPDLHATIHQQLAEGDKVVTYKTFRGTHQGVFMGVQPTGKQITFAVIDILRLANGKIVEHWAVQDRTALLQQLGMLTVPAPEATERRHN